MKKIKEINTNEVFHNIKNNVYFDKKLSDDNFLDNENIAIFIKKMIDETDTRSNVFYHLNIDSNNGYKYLNGQRTMKRDIVLRFLIYFKLGIDEVQTVLKHHKYEQLYPKIKRDFIIITAITHLHSYEKTNELLKLNEQFLL